MGGDKKLEYFMKLVKQMRNAQKKYRNSLSDSTKKEMNDCEKSVDNYQKEYYKETEETPSLF